MQKEKLTLIGKYHAKVYLTQALVTQFQCCRH